MFTEEPGACFPIAWCMCWIFLIVIVVSSTFRGLAPPDTHRVRPAKYWSCLAAICCMHTCRHTRPTDPAFRYGPTKICGPRNHMRRHHASALSMLVMLLYPWSYLCCQTRQTLQITKHISVTGCETGRRWLAPHKQQEQHRTATSSFKRINYIRWTWGAWPSCGSVRSTQCNIVQSLIQKANKSATVACLQVWLLHISCLQSAYECWASLACRTRSPFPTQCRTSLPARASCHTQHVKWRHPLFQQLPFHRRSC